MAPEDRPREKLLARGTEVLGTNELLAVVLGTGTPRLSALELANEILSSAGGLTGLAHLSPPGLARLKGLKTARTTRLVAALELGKTHAHRAFRALPHLSYARRRGEIPLASFRCQAGRGVRSTHTGHPQSTETASDHLAGESQWQSGPSPRGISGGGRPADGGPRPLSQPSLGCDLTPSREDRSLTRRLREAGNIMGIEVLDHVIVGRGRFVSLKEKGLL